MFADRGENLDEALALIKKALEYEPNNGAYLDSLGWVYYRLGRYEEAVRYLERAAEKVAGDPVVHDHLGDAYAKLDRLAEAITHWKRAIEEWNSSAASEKDQADVEKIRKKLEGAQIRLAKEASPAQTNKP
jgi:tetratricopeptide (TPR) repeat protein